jgi:preprotein translocase subunit SecB
MKAKKSPLALKAFLLLNNKYQFIRGKDKQDVSALMEDYDIDIDYAIIRDNEGEYQLFTKIGINNIENPLPGYKIFIEGVSIFSFDEKLHVSERDKKMLLHISGLNICINSLRNVISIITSNGPFGKYTLPSIDVNQLLKDKRLTGLKGRK